MSVATTEASGTGVVIAPGLMGTVVAVEDGEEVSAVLSFWAHPVVEKNALAKVAARRWVRGLGFMGWVDKSKAVRMNCRRDMTDAGGFRKSEQLTGFIECEAGAAREEFRGVAIAEVAEKI